MISGLRYAAQKKKEEEEAAARAKAEAEENAAPAENPTTEADEPR